MFLHAAAAKLPLFAGLKTQLQEGAHLRKTLFCSVKTSSESDALFDSVVQQLEKIKEAHDAYDDFLRNSRIYSLLDVDIEMHRYRYLMDQMEEEESTVPVILNAVIEQVCVILLSSAVSVSCKADRLYGRLDGWREK